MEDFVLTPSLTLVDCVEVLNWSQNSSKRCQNENLNGRFCLNPFTDPCWLGDLAFLKLLKAVFVKEGWPFSNR